MNRAPVCTACSATMKPGFIPDLMHGSGAAGQSWHPGHAEDQKILGLKTGNVKYDKKLLLSITAWRCPTCGLVLQFAK